MASEEDEAFDDESPPAAAVAENDAEGFAVDVAVAEWEWMQKADQEMGK